jgi:hypothetical protein
MDDQRFDAALRALNTGVTRRRGLAAALGVLFGTAGVADAAKKTGKQADSGPSTEGPCGDGSSKANRCKRNGQCCTKYCLNGACRLKPNQMTCAKGSECASGSCVNNKCDGGCKKEGSRCSTSANCCNGLTCQVGVCKSSTKAVCNAKNCKGCCNGTVCRVGTATSTCGTGGAACARCASGQTCTAGVCVSPTPPPPPPPSCTLELQTISGTDDSAISNPKGVYLSPDKLTLFIASWNPADSSTGGRVSIWTRASLSAQWAFDQKLESADLLKPEFVTASADGNTVATASKWNECGVVFKKTSGTWSQTGTLGSCGSGGSGDTQLSSPTSVALNADGTTAYIGDRSNGRIAIWKYASSAWGFDSQILSKGGGGQCGSGSDPNAKTCPEGVFVDATETKIYICSGTFDHGLQLLTKSGSTWTGAWAGPAEAAPYGGGGCWVDPVTENVLAHTLGGEVQLSNFTTGTSWTNVTLTSAPTGVLGITVRDFDPASPDTATWAFAEGFSGVQASACPA